MKRVRCGGNLYRREVPPGAIYIGRPSRWQNPYSVLRYGLDGALRLYEGWLRDEPVALAEAVYLDCRLTLHGPALIDAARIALAGKDLACWCPPDARCHGDLLIAAIEGRLA